MYNVNFCSEKFPVTKKKPNASYPLMTYACGYHAVNIKKLDRLEFFIIHELKLTQMQHGNLAKPLPECDTMLWWPAVTKPPPSPLTSLLSRKPKILFPFSFFLTGELW